MTQATGSQPRTIFPRFRVSADTVWAIIATVRKKKLLGRTERKLWWTPSSYRASGSRIDSVGNPHELHISEAATQSTTAPNVSAETHKEKPILAAQRADAMAVIAESFLKHGHEALSGG